MANEADRVSLVGFRSESLVVETKPDMTPVSEADRGVEHKLRTMLAAHRPDDGIMGEEFDDVPAAHGTRRWVIDPIDGTKNYVRGVPVWATLIALETGEQDGTHTRVGVVSAPALGMRWWASVGGGSWKIDPASLSPRRLRVSAVAALADANLSYSELSEWRAAGKRDAFIALADAVWRTRGFGDFWSHLMVAEGVVDLATEPELSRWDMAALQIIVEEAGGRFTDLLGQRGSSGGSLLCSNGLLHEAALHILSR